MGQLKRKRDIYSGQSPSEIPVYRFSEAARYLGVPPATLRSWFFGQDFWDDKGKKRFFKPPIGLSNEAKKKKLLSFNNLVEAHVLSAIRKHHGVSMPKVRRTIEFIKKEYKTNHPLIEKMFRTDGVDLFVYKLNAVITASTDSHQTIIRQALETHLERIEWDRDGIAAKLYPFIRFDHVASAPKIIVINPRVAFGRPTVAGTGIAIDVVIDRFYAGDSPEALAKDYRCDESKILEAIRCATQKAA